MRRPSVPRACRSARASKRRCAAIREEARPSSMIARRTGGRRLHDLPGHRQRPRRKVGNLVRHRLGRASVLRADHFGRRDAPGARTAGRRPRCSKMPRQPGDGRHAGTLGGVADQLSVGCARLNLVPVGSNYEVDIGAITWLAAVGSSTGGSPAEDSCPAGSIVTGDLIRADVWINGLALHCAPLALVP